MYAIRDLTYIPAELCEQQVSFFNFKGCVLNPFLAPF